MAKACTAGVSLPATTVAVRRARRFIERQLLRWGGDDVVDDAQLIGSELVTNMVQHSPHGGFLTLALGRERLRIALIDHGDGIIALDERPPGEGDARRGLLVVSRIAVAWGVEAELGMKGHRVWCDLLRGPAAPVRDRRDPRDPRGERRRTGGTGAWTLGA